MEVTRSCETPVPVHQSTHLISEQFIHVTVTTASLPVFFGLRGTTLLTCKYKTANKMRMSVCIRFFVQRQPILALTDSAVYKTLH